MFGLFKKTSWEIEGKAFGFFQEVFKHLPSEFEFILQGLEKGLYKRFSINHARKGNFYSIGFDPLQSDQSMVKGKHFDLENILIIQNGQGYPLNISIHDGLWIGFEIEKSILNFDNYHIDISSFKKNKIGCTAGIDIEKLVKGLTCEQLELNNLNEINIDEKIYYQIKDLSDGNYITIDNKGQVFGLIHDPYKIELINDSISQFVDDVNNGRFDFDKYLEDKNSNTK